MFARIAAARRLVRGAGVCPRWSIALSRPCPVARASSSKRATTRLSSSIAPPRRWRYCCPNSGACEATTPPRSPKARPTVRAMRGKGRPLLSSSSGDKSLAHLLFRHLGHRLRELAGARLLPRLHDEDHGLGAGTGRIGADDLVDREGRAGGNPGRGARPTLHALDRVRLRRRLAEEPEAHEVSPEASGRRPARPRRRRRGV